VIDLVRRLFNLQEKRLVKTPDDGEQD
jgi:hypothetical protein